MKKRLLSLILVIALALTALPFTAFAQTNGLMYGDVNLDGEIDLLDILTMKLYLVEDNPADFSFENADVNADNEVDLVDLLLSLIHIFNTYNFSHNIFLQMFN